MATKKTKVEFSAETSKYEKSMRDVQRVSKKTSQGISRAWKTASIAAAAATAAMVVGFKSAIDAASDLQEVQGKFDVVFAAHKEQAEDMAKILVDSYAMSSREAKQYMSSIQDLLVPMGMASDKALLMSGEVVKLSADLASFNNLPTAQVMLDIQSALVGNFETMKKYGVILNEHVLKQKALEMGLYSGKGMVDANAKAQVAFKLILEGSTFAIGDQIRTMGSYANQMKQLTVNIEELSAMIGNELLPIATDVISQINTWVKNNDNLIRQKIPVYFNEIKDSMQKIWNVITYNPAILEYGLVGLAFFGREGWKYVAYVAAAAHLGTVTATLGKALGLVYAGVLDISEVATANFKELQELIERFDFPDPFLDLQLQAKQLEERIERLKKVTTGRIFTFRGDKEELVKLQSELIETQSKIAAIKTLAGLKVSGRLEGALADPDKYYGGSAPEAPSSTTPDKLQRTKEYYKELEGLAQDSRNVALEIEDEETRMFRENLDYRLELQKQYYGSIEAAAQEARDSEEEIEDEKMRMAAETAAYQKELNAQRLSDIQSSISMMTQGFQTISEMGGKHSKEAFAMYKGFKIIETIIATRSAAIKAYESLVGIPLVGPYIAPAAAAAAVTFGMAQVAMIQSAQPPSYDQGGISRAAGIYQTGPIEEAHVPLKGGAIPVNLSGGSQKSITIVNYMENPVFQDVETQRQVFAQIAEVVARSVVPDAVVQNYNDDGIVRQMVQGGK